MHSSDETGDERKGLATTGGTATDGDPATQPGKLPAHAFRERIRRASVAAAQSSVPPDATTSQDAQDANYGTAPSLLAPEQSGVHDRTSDEPEAPTFAAQSDNPQGGSNATAATGGGSRKQTPPRAWPFAGAARDDRRPQYHTQLGLGMPQRPAAPAPILPTAKVEEHADQEVSDARRRMDTRDTKRSGAGHSALANAAGSGGGGTRPTPLPGAYKITPPRPFRSHDSAKWSPTSTKPQRASLLRGDAPQSSRSNAAAAATSPSDESRLSKTLKHGSELDPKSEKNLAIVVEQAGTDPAAAHLDPSKYTLRELAEEQSGAGGFADPAAAVKGESANAGDEEDGTRARRYTPKQRPSQRRVRERSVTARTRGADASKDADKQDNEPRREQATTVPDIRIPVTSRPPPLPLSAAAAAALNATKPHGAQVVTPDTPTQPRGRPVPRLPLSAPPPVFSPPAAFSSAFAPPPAFSQPGARAQRPDSAFHAPRSPFPPAVTHRGDAESAFSQHEASIVIDPALNGPLPLPLTEVDAGPNSSSSFLSEASSSGYQPLPSDPAAFEQLMREQAAARGSRLNWKQQATLVIPRESLGVPEERRFINPKVVGGFLAASALGALLMLGIAQLGDQPSGARLATDTSTSAAHTAAGGVTVIATEPSGAELLFDGAVVGNTPLEVVRPPRGQAELTYVVRLRGFTQELVRLGSDSQAAIRVTLTPESGVP